MSDVKHTPGPWVYGLGYRVRPDRGLDDQGREVGGPTVCELNADADRCCPPAGEIEANGRLIAAAPDLLAACEMILDVRYIMLFRLGSDCHSVSEIFARNGVEDVQALARKAQDLAQSAIDKVKGIKQ